MAYAGGRPAAAPISLCWGPSRSAGSTSPKALESGVASQLAGGAATSYRPREKGRA